MKMLLLLLSIILFVVLAPIGFLFGLIRNIVNLNDYFFKIAICIDQAGNVICAPLFNVILITQHGYEFGDEDETISGVLGKNKKSNTLSKAGWMLANLLNKIEKDHVEKAIE